MEIGSLETCVDPESFVRGGPTLTTVIIIYFFRGERESKQIPL